LKNLRDFTYDELLHEVETLGERPYRAVQIYGWTFKKGAPDIDSMTDISHAFRARLKELYCIGVQHIPEVQTSADSTKKFMAALDDGAAVESVIIPEGRRLTLCVSSQAGCALGCGFCMTGKAGLVRNLKLSELAGQVFSARELLGPDRALTNVVVMGMGEPLLNYDNVVRFLGVLTDPRAFGFSHNKVTLSTAGVVPGIKRLGRDSNVNLAVSLNATTDAVRSRIMPINKKYPIRELMAALKGYPLSGKKHITFEYVLMKGVNDSDEDARRLIKLLKGIRSKINLIPLNPFPGVGFEPPDKERLASFYKILQRSKQNVVIRASKGAEIQAACGQLWGKDY
jgi:23S rRNA (adenine2503-C2)-methyltransferase